MSEKPCSTWRDTLNIVIDSISAERFRENLDWLREEYGDDPDDVGATCAYMLADWFVESVGLFAALQLPPRDVPAALAEIRETLAHLDFKQEQKRLKRGERRYYEGFAKRATLLFPELGQAMEALFNCYVSGDYDPEANPNDLIAEALETAGDDLDHAHHLITQAGAVALHSRPLWWRWQEEADGPTETWLIAIATLVEDYTGGGKMVLGPLEQARADAEASRREVAERIERMKSKEKEPVDEPPPVDDLIAELIEQGQTLFTPEQLALCRDYREEAIPTLIDLATDEYLQMELAPGDGHAPINAVRLLGELEAVEAIPALVDIVADVDVEAIIRSAAIFALQKIGQPALEPILTFMRYSWDVEAKIGLAEAIDIEMSGPDERLYQALVAVWEEATWEEGKCLLAHPLAQTGGERAIPVLAAALEHPDLDNLVDYNEVAHALTELGVEAPPPPVDMEMFDFAYDVNDVDIGEPAYTVLQEVSDPAHLMASIGKAPEEWHTRPETLAHAYTAVELNRLNGLFAMQAVLLPPQLSMLLTASLLEATEALTFDASTRDYPHWLRETYTHLAECAGPELGNQLTGVLVSLQYYLEKDYDIADDPDQLLAAASKLSLESEAEAEELWHLFGQAGALILHGRSFWPRWPAETDLPLSDWLAGLVEFRHILERIGHIPLRPSTETTPDELTATLLKAMMEMEEKQAPPAAAQLLDLLIGQKQDTLSPAQRRRFTHQRAAIVPHLIRMVKDKKYWYEDSPGEGWTAILAARLLGELKVSQATHTLVSAVADSDPEDIIHEAALFSLMNIGRPALPAVKTYFRYGRDVETKTALAEILGQIGRQRPDSFGFLRQVWESADWDQNRRMVALAFGDLRDRRAIPLLQAALEDQNTDALDLDYVHWALRRLGAPATSPPAKKSSHFETPTPYNPRLIYDEFDTPQRLRYNVWGEPLCPDCGQPLGVDEEGDLTHLPPTPLHHSAPQGTKRKRKKRRR